MATNYKIIKRDITHGLTNDEVNIAGSGDFIMLVRKPTGVKVEVRFNSNYNDPIELSEWMGIVCKDTERIYLTCNAKAGNFIELLQTKNRNEFDVIPPVRNKLDIGSIDEVAGGNIDINDISASAAIALQKTFQLKEKVFERGENKQMLQQHDSSFQTYFSTERANFDELDIHLAMWKNINYFMDKTCCQMMRVSCDGVVVHVMGKILKDYTDLESTKFNLRDCRGKSIGIIGYFKLLDTTDQELEQLSYIPFYNSWHLQGYKNKYRNEAETELYNHSFTDLQLTMDSTLYEISPVGQTQTPDKIYINNLQVKTVYDLNNPPAYIDLPPITLSAANNYYYKLYGVGNENGSLEFSVGVNASTNRFGLYIVRSGFENYYIRRFLLNLSVSAVRVE